MKEGWEVKKLGEVCDVKSGKSIQAAYIKEDDSISPYKCYGGNGIRGYVDSYTHDGIYPIIGRVGALCGNIHLAIGKFNATEHALIVDIKNKDVNAYWMVYNLKHLDLRKIAKGVAQPVISAGEVMKIYTNIPPLPEQSRIVEELDLLSNIIEKKRQQLSELDNLAQSIFYDMFGDPVSNEKGWEVKKLGEVCVHKSQIERANKCFSSVDIIQYIDISSINNSDNTICHTNVIKFLDAPSRAQQRVVNNDVLISLVRPNLKNVALVNNSLGNLVASTGFCVLRTTDLVSPYYLLFSVLSDCFTKYLMDRTSGANYPAVREEDIKGYDLCIPPLSLQQLFAQKIEAIEKQKELIKQSIAETEELFNSRMDYYFS